VADRIVNMVDGRIKSDVLVHEADVIVEFLKKVDYFSGLSVGTLASVADKMWTEQHGAGDVVIRQGDSGKNFYVVRQGEVEVVKQDGNGQRVVARLAQGNCFGEEALLKGQPRSATVRTTAPSVLYVLGEADFREALDASESLREELHKVLFERQ
jgi:putative ABC transport system ATP-binding protein